MKSLLIPQLTPSWGKISAFIFKKKNFFLTLPCGKIEDVDSVMKCRGLAACSHGSRWLFLRYPLLVYLYIRRWEWFSSEIWTAGGPEPQASQALLWVRFLCLAFLNKNSRRVCRHPNSCSTSGGTHFAPTCSGGREGAQPPALGLACWRGVGLRGRQCPLRAVSGNSWFRNLKKEGEGEERLQDSWPNFKMKRGFGKWFSSRKCGSLFSQQNCLFDSFFLLLKYGIMWEKGGFYGLGVIFLFLGNFRLRRVAKIVV